MAIIHEATLVPTKLELLGPWLAAQPWGSGEGDLERLGSYRFDDPAGEVGIEGMILGRGSVLFHVVLTYRSAPLLGAEASLMGTMQHSALGTRWVYDGVGDPVAVEALARAARGEQHQAELEVHGAAGVTHRDPDMRVGAGSATAGPARGDEAVGIAVAVASGGARLRIARVLGGPMWGRHPLVASWAGGTSTLAVLD